MELTFERHGIPGNTARVAVTDVAQSFNAAQLVNNNRHATAVLITCETNNVRFTFGTSVPTQGAAGLGHILYVAQSLRLTNEYAIAHFNFINHTNGANAFLNVTFEFDRI